MAQELLSICIPTYNRSALLKEMLGQIARQAREAGLGATDLVVYVSDNASPDDTPQIIAAFEREATVPLVSSRNTSNLGVSRNLLKVITMGQGRFTWTLGDDEILQPGAIANLVQSLRREDPGLVLAFPANYKWPLPAPRRYADYREFTQACLALHNVQPLAEQTLLSSNIYRSACFDMAIAEEKIDTYFPHMFGMLRPLLAQKLPVLMPDYPIIAVREHDRGAPSDGVWVAVDEYWVTYLSWLREEMQLPDLDPHMASRMARQEMFRNIRTNPLGYLRKNWRALFQPSAYRFFLKRVIGMWG